MLNTYFPAAEAATAAPAASEARLPSGSGERVLLVEDDPGVLHAAHRILSAHGYQVIAHSSPAAALRLCADSGERIDLLVTDVMMPALGGAELARQAGASRPDLHVLYMSGYPRAVVAHQGIVAADVRLVEKPFTRQSLLRAVREALTDPGSPS